VGAVVNALRYYATKNRWYRKYPDLLPSLEEELRAFVAISTEHGVERDTATWSMFANAIIGWQLEYLQ